MSKTLGPARWPMGSSPGLVVDARPGGIATNDQWPVGATIGLAPGTVGWLHISKLRPLAGGTRVGSVDAHLRVGQKIEPGEIGADERGHILLALVTRNDEAASVRERRVPLSP